MRELIDLFLHVDKHLATLVATYGPLIYGMLFAIVFAETGLVVTPFLPGDSLLFAVGALCASGAMSIWVAVPLLIVAAIAGDAVNYVVGRSLGRRVFTEDVTTGWRRFINRQHVLRAHEFFERYGGKAIVMGRFVPIVRTFVPFVAGAVEMTYASFAFYNVTGGIAWVAICCGAGYAFGNIPVVKNNFSLVALGIVFVSVLPIVYELLSAKRPKDDAGPGPGLAPEAP